MHLSQESLWVNGAHLWFPPEVELVELITFPDRTYLGAITRRASNGLLYASLAESVPEDEECAAQWQSSGLWEAMTDSQSHAREMIESAYQSLERRQDFAT